MPNRMIDSDIWEQDWFIRLPMPFKLAYLYCHTQAEQSGILRLKRNRLRQDLLNNAMFYVDEFLIAVNKDDDEQVFNRIIKLGNGNFFLTQHIPGQIGHFFNWRIGAHRRILKDLVINKIHPSEIPNFDFSGIQNLDFQDISKIAHAKPKQGVCLDDLLAMFTPRLDIYNDNDNDNINDKDNDNDNKGGAGGKKNQQPAKPESILEPEYVDEEFEEESYSEADYFLPGEADRGRELNQVERGACIQYMKLVKQSDFSDEEISQQFEGFKIQYFNGKRPYRGGWHEVTNHFRNWLKPKQIHTNGKQFNGSGNAGNKQSTFDAYKNF